jgi:hypothetical protein
MLQNERGSSCPNTETPGERLRAFSRMKGCRNGPSGTQKRGRARRAHPLDVGSQSGRVQRRVRPGLSRPVGAARGRESFAGPWWCAVPAPFLRPPASSRSGALQRTPGERQRKTEPTADGRTCYPGFSPRGVIGCVPLCRPAFRLLEARFPGLVADGRTGDRDWDMAEFGGRRLRPASHVPPGTPSVGPSCTLVHYAFSGRRGGRGRFASSLTRGGVPGPKPGKPSWRDSGREFALPYGQLRRPGDGPAILVFTTARVRQEPMSRDPGRQNRARGTTPVQDGRTEDAIPPCDAPRTPGSRTDGEETRQGGTEGGPIQSCGCAPGPCRFVR